MKFFFINYNSFEFHTKTNQNDNIFELFFFFWTNSWVNFFFWGTLYFSILLFSNIRGILIAACFFFFYLTAYANEISSFFFNNYNFNLHNTIIYNHSFLLLNNLNRIHPFVLYLSSVFFVFFFFVFQLFLQKKFFFSIPAFKCLYYNISKNSFYFSWTALILGGWWAQQEDSWNGWWNWDSSETLGLVVPIGVLFVLHQINKNFFQIRLNLLHVLFARIALFTYLCVQLNFDQTNHNFGTKFFFFFNNFFFLIIFFFNNFFLLFQETKWVKKKWGELTILRSNGSSRKISEFSPSYWLLPFFFKILIISFTVSVAFSRSYTQVFYLINENIWFFNETHFNQFFIIFLCSKIYPKISSLFYLHLLISLFFVVISLNIFFEFSASWVFFTSWITGCFSFNSQLNFLEWFGNFNLNLFWKTQITNFFFFNMLEEMSSFLTSKCNSFLITLFNTTFGNFHEVNFVSEIFFILIFYISISLILF